MSNTFQDGDRIHETFVDINGDKFRFISRPDAFIMEITQKGFRYQYVEPVWTREGMITGGECYLNGFDSWEIVKPGEEVDHLNVEWKK